jgi:LPS-assembly lipoprotein
MWWCEPAWIARSARLAVALAMATSLAGCFEPMYGQRSVLGGPSIRERLSAVEIAPIQAPQGTPLARVAVEVRNALIFDITGGAATASPTHQLRIQFAAARQPVIVDITSARTDVEQYAINAYYSLFEIATNKMVMNGQTFARVTYDNPGQQQRFAQARGLRDAENRASKLIADNIKSRLASFFVAGT